MIVQISSEIVVLNSSKLKLQGPSSQSSGGYYWTYPWIL